MQTPVGACARVESLAQGFALGVARPIVVCATAMPLRLGVGGDLHCAHSASAVVQETTISSTSIPKAACDRPRRAAAATATTRRQREKEMNRASSGALSICHRPCPALLSEVGRLRAARLGICPGPSLKADRLQLA
jgi:hypothetical protein